MIYFIIIIALIIIINKWPSSTLPVIYTYNSDLLPTILVLAGTHGNEPGPAHGLSKLINNKSIRNLVINAKYYIVPYVNNDAIDRNVRYTWWQPDINRSYPDGNEINKYLLPYINKANLIIDFHEGWGFHTCSNNESMGQTIETSNKEIYPLIKKVVNKLNLESKLCEQWTAIYDKVPKLGGSLKEYSKKIGVPYILIEIAGQNDIMPLSTRIIKTEQILRLIINLISIKYEVQKK